ncbi:hypothetical protein K504DRAFT_370065 [Pleomassaria siparia CBS 279.74]|uniref:Uncharacterized protein n=1 Tax=Pleomassaria siparia CBS 279.74 TaxID=1314801 RepID=A0A6G1KJ59_9PLEO|nr:hypothetical protein K504DRAFT_370065 [Pleomassaria siparia CBS 279.74]
MTWKSVTGTIGSFKETMMDGLRNGVNQAFQGTDVPEMHNKMIDLIPLVSAPSMRQLGKAVDNLGDAFRDIDVVCPLRKRETEEYHLASNMQGAKWTYARLMGEKARMALVQQRICGTADIIPGRGILDWTECLNKALVILHEKEEDNYKFSKMLDMAPVWVPDRARDTWRLVIDTGIVDVEPVGDDFEESKIELDVDFELMGRSGWASVRDVTRGSTAVVDGEWEMVDM